MRLTRVAPALALAVVLLAPSPAQAIHLGVDVGAGAWLLSGPVADAHFRVDQELFDWIRIGVRPGVMFAFTEPTTRFGVPLDAAVKFKLFVLYLDVFGGIVWLPSYADPVRMHIGGGVGFRLWKLEFGFEVAYLQPSITAMGRIGFTFYGPDKKEDKAKEAR